LICCLVYHSVGIDHSPRSVRASDLERHIKLIRKRGASIVGPEALNSSGKYDESALNFLFTFDDGLANHRENVLPVLHDHGIKGLFFVPTAKLGLPGRLTKNSLREVVDAGHLAGVHGHSHDRWDMMSSSVLQAELETSRRTLSEICGTEPSHVAPPGGFFNARTVNTVRAAGFSTLRGMRWGVNRSWDPFALEVLPMSKRFGDPMLRLAISGGGPMVIELGYRAKHLLRKLSS